MTIVPVHIFYPLLPLQIRPTLIPNSVAAETWVRTVLKGRYDHGLSRKLEGKRDG